MFYLCFVAADETEDEETEREEDEEWTVLANTGMFTQYPTAPEVGLAPSREPLQPSVDQEEQLEKSKHNLKGECVPQTPS